MITKTISAAALAFTSALLFCSCAPADDDVADAVEPGSVEPSVFSSFCVDHPCADLTVHNFGYCPKSGNSLLIGIDNVGTATSGASKAKFYVDYYNYSYTYDVPSLAPGAHYNFFAALPTGCLVYPGCSWGVIADATSIVSEPNANNNTRKGACIY
jgi:hypothetical protein